MVPNHTLNHLIHQWVQKFGQKTHESFGHFDSNVSLVSLKNTLESKQSSFDQKTQALEHVRWLSEDLFNRNEGLIQLGFYPLVLESVFGERFGQNLMGFVEKLLDCALKLMPFCYSGHLNILRDESKFENFSVLFKEGSRMVKIRLCSVIEGVFVSSGLETKELATKIGNENKVLQVLISLLDDYEQNPKVSEAGIKAILGLLSSSIRSCNENLIKEGLVHSLVAYILEVDKGEKLVQKPNEFEPFTTQLGSLPALATRALELVLKLESGKQEFVRNEVGKGVKALVEMVFRVSGDEEGSESAVNSLLILCCESKQVMEKAICGGILTQLLLLLQSQSSGRAKTKARILLQLLRSMWANE